MVSNNYKWSFGFHFYELCPNSTGLSGVAFRIWSQLGSPNSFWCNGERFLLSPKPGVSGWMTLRAGRWMKTPRFRLLESFHTSQQSISQGDRNQADKVRRCDTQWCSHHPWSLTASGNIGSGKTWHSLKAKSPTILTTLRRNRKNCNGVNFGKKSTASLITASE